MKLGFQGYVKSASKYWIRQIMIASLIYFQFIHLNLKLIGTILYAASFSPCPFEPGYILSRKQCRSRSASF